LKRLLFVCYPDTNYPIGGVKQIYRQCELLCELGFDSYVLHQEPNFRVTWFSSSAPVLDIQSYLKSFPSSDDDLIILPETWVSNVPHYFPGIKKVIFNQNVYYTFGLDGNFDSNILDYYSHPDIQAIVTVSVDNYNFLVQGCGFNTDFVHVLLNGIDSNLFYPPSVKTRTIAFLDRKHSYDAKVISQLAPLRTTFNRYSFMPIGNMSHQDVSKKLQSALVFLSCGHPEGFGLPLAEAIACGCIVVGYHGLAGRDYCHSILHEVEFGDILGFINKLEHAINEFESEPQQTSNKLHYAADSILRRYSLDKERQACSRVWSILSK